MRFIQGEVSWLVGRDDLARGSFERLLQYEHPSPDMAAHARQRLAAIYRADGSDATPGPAGSNIEERSQPAR